MLQTEGQGLRDCKDCLREEKAVPSEGRGIGMTYFNTRIPNRSRMVRSLKMKVLPGVSVMLR